MIRFLLRVALIGGVLGWVVDRALAARRGERPPDPIHSTVEINAPIERVWETLTDVEGQPRWMRDLKAVRLLTPAPIGIGTTAEGEVRIFGMQTVDPITVTSFEPPRRFAIRHEGRFSGEGVIELEPGSGGRTTIVRWDETLVPPQLPHLSSAALRPILERVFAADLERLRTLVEMDRASD